MFGTFSFFVNAAQSISLLIDLGLCATLVRVASGNPNRYQRRKLLNATVWFQALLYISICGALVLSADWVLAFFAFESQRTLYFVAILIMISNGCQIICLLLVNAKYNGLNETKIHTLHSYLYHKLCLKIEYIQNFV